AERDRLRGRSRRIAFTLRRPSVVSQGPSQPTVENYPTTGSDSQASPATTTPSENPNLKPPSAANFHEMEMLTPATRQHPSDGASGPRTEQVPAQLDTAPDPPSAIRRGAQQNST